MAAAALTPRVRMMTICDGVRESKTEQAVFHLKGVRQGVAVDRVPWTPDRLWLFVTFSSPRTGEYICYIRVVHDRTDRTIYFSYFRPRLRFATDGEITARRAPIRCKFPEAGQYTVQLWFFQNPGNDVLKGEIPFFVHGEEA